ncbi:MAG: hypothetical protein HYR84_08440, partial [Planctomycetes bacterium]|nr:hypothetical protein [Planctomycetota bacterium]
MDTPTTPAEGPADWATGATWTLPSWAFLLGATALFAWHAWLTLSLFGDNPRENLFNDQPIVSGAHPQHLYLGTLGARGILVQGRTTVYDHANLAGYPKTPIFDGARLAELLLVLGGGSYQPAAYKIGFAILCMLVPILLLITCGSLDMGPGTSLLAIFLGQLIWWGPHGRAALLTGDCELYLASLAALAHIGFLISYHRVGSATAWLGMLLTASLGWFLQPTLFPLALPVLLIYYLSVGAKHEFTSWHVAFWSAQVLGMLVNLPWLINWLDSWWLRTPLPTAADLLEHRTFATIWHAPLWGGSTSRLLAIALTLGAAVGVVILNQTRQRPTARMLGMSASGSLALAVLGIAWEPLGAVGTAALLAPALWFACIPAAHAGVCMSTWLIRQGFIGRCVCAATWIGAGLAFTALTETPLTLLDRCVPSEPLEVGLGHRREMLVQTLLEHTSGEGRILWEDRQRSRQASRWPALLPLLTGRTFIGGLDPDGFIEHSSVSLINQSLEGWPIATAWSDEKLKDYCRRYNVRWIVAWSPAVIERYATWTDARKIKPLEDGELRGWLFEVERTPSYA